MNDEKYCVGGSCSWQRRGCGHCGNHGGRRDRLPVFSLWYEAFAKGGGCRFVPVEAPYRGSVIHFRTVSRSRGRYFPLSLGCSAVAPHGWGRSEERRVWTVCVSTCRAGGSPVSEKKKNKN